MSAGGIPSRCKCCSRELTIRDVERFADLCDVTGFDPLVHGSKGIKCAGCLAGAIFASPEFAAALVAEAIAEDIPRPLRARMVAGGEA